MISRKYKWQHKNYAVEIKTGSCPWGRYITKEGTTVFKGENLKHYYRTNESKQVIDILVDIYHGLALDGISADDRDLLLSGVKNACKITNLVDNLSEPEETTKKNIYVVPKLEPKPAPKKREVVKEDPTQLSLF